MRMKLGKEYGKIKKMSDETYAQRRQVMNFIYEAKNLLRSKGVDMPRINIRITETHNCTSNYAGMATLGARDIYIPTRTLNKAYLKQVVYHELVHAITGFMHDEKCKLMHQYIQEDITPEQLDERFLSYFK